MPGLAVDGLTGGDRRDSETHIGGIVKSNLMVQTSPKSPLTQSHVSGSSELSVEGIIDTSIEQLYHNVCDMQSSDHSPSRASFISYGAESRIDSELCHLVGVKKVEKTREALVEIRNEIDEKGTNKENSKIKSMIEIKSISRNAKRSSPLKLINQASSRSSHRTQISMKQDKDIKKVNSFKRNLKLPPTGAEDISNETALDDPNLGFILLNQTRELLSANNSKRALKVALKAKKAFEARSGIKPNLDMVMCLHVLAAVYCSLGQFEDAILILERSIEIPVIDEGNNHALAKYSGCMQLGDTYAMLGQLENSILFYTAGLEIQRQILGETDPRVGETFRYVAETHVQALQFDEAQKLCQCAVDIHKENHSPGSIEEAADRRLMGLICDSKGDHATAIEHYVLASMYMSTYGNEADIASIDCNIGDSYLSLSRYDEAISAYQKALNGFKKSKGEYHPTVASVYVRMAELNNKIGQFKESKIYCEDAVRIYQKPIPGIPAEEYANGFIEVSAIFESRNELQIAEKLLKKALKTYKTVPGQQSTIAGIEAQMGVMNYVMGNYQVSYDLFKSSILKFRASSEKKSAAFGIALNQMGLSCVQLREISKAAELFQEARDVLEKEYGKYHPDTLGVYSNLAGTYDAMGRLVT